jgi:hypothetical protein
MLRVLSGQRLIYEDLLADHDLRPRWLNGAEILGTPRNARVDRIFVDNCRLLLTGQ